MGWMGWWASEGCDEGWEQSGSAHLKRRTWVEQCLGRSFSFDALRPRHLRRPRRRLELIGAAVRQYQLPARVVCRRHREHAQKVAERGPAQAA